MRRAGFVLDLDRCTGCSACAFACRIENELPAGASFRRVTTFNPGRRPGVPVLHLSLACSHCERPACLVACPTGAYTRNAATGAVDLDTERCMGCRYCSWVCPYGAPQFDRSLGVMTKCTFCAPRVERGRLPACVVACPVDALQVLETRPRSGPVAGTRESRLGRARMPGFPDTGIEPALELVSRRRWRPASEEERDTASRETHLEGGNREPRWQRLGAEWPLALFTLVVAVLAGWAGAAACGGPRPAPLPFLALAGLGLGASVLHLGRPARLWRALCNVRSSWISREISLVMTFLAAACAHFFVAPANRPLAWAVAGLGLAAVVAIDLVYRIRGQLTRTVPHSSMATLTALFLAGLWGPAAGLAAGAGLAKLVLYAGRHRRAARSGPAAGLLLPVLRITLGFVVPAIAWTAGASLLAAPVIAAVLGGETLDRAEFYAELDFLTPERQAARDLAEQLAARPARV